MSENLDNQAYITETSTEPYSSVEFINQQVLQPDVKPIMGTSKVMADQAAAMMIQDVETFLQGNEQMMTVAAGAAIALVLAGDENGEKTLTQLGNWLVTINTYAAGVGVTATEIAATFGVSDSGVSDIELDATLSPENNDNSIKEKGSKGKGKMRSFLGF